MDSLSSPRLNRRARYDSFPILPQFADLNNNPPLHPPFGPLALHPAAPPPPPPPPAFSRNHTQDTRKAFVHPPGDNFYHPFPYGSKSVGFDPASLPIPRVSDCAIYHGLPHEKPLLPEILTRNRGGGGGGAVDKPGVFDETPRLSNPYYENFFKLGDSDSDLMSRTRPESGQDRLLGEDFDRRNQRQIRLWDGRERRCHYPFFEQLPPEAVYLAAEPSPFSSSRGGADSGVFVHRPPMSRLSSGHSFTDMHVISSTAAMVANSQLFGNRLGPQQGQSICKTKNYIRDVPPNHGFRRRQHQEYKTIKKSDPINVSKEDGLGSNYHMVTKAPSLPSLDYEHELEVDCSIGKGKRKMSNDRTATYYARSVKHPMQKPSAFSRIHSGLSVWDRLEEKPLILSPPSSLPCPLSSPPELLNETEAKHDILDFSVKSNTVVSKVVDPLNIEPSSIKGDFSVERSVEKPIRVTKKKKKKRSFTREKVKTPIVSVSAGSCAKQSVGKIANASFGSVSLKAEANKEEVSSCMSGSKFIPCNFKMKVKKLPVGKLHGAKEAAKVASRLEGCTNEIPYIEDSIGTPKFDGADKHEKDINDCSPKVINDSHLQFCLKGPLTPATPISDVSSTIIIKSTSQTQDSVIEILDDSGDECMELGNIFDNGCRSTLVSDAPVIVNASSQPTECIIPFNKLPTNNVVTQDSSVSMDEIDATNSRKQVRLEVTGSVKEIMPPPDNSTSPELLDAGGIFISSGSSTISHINDYLNCDTAEIEIDRHEKRQEKMVLLTDAKEPEVPGKYLSSQSCLHGLQDPSFSDSSNATANQEIPSDGTIKENMEFNLSGCNILPQSGCNWTSQDNSCAPRIDSNGSRLEQDSLLGPMKIDSPAVHFGDTFLSHPHYSESMKIINSTSSGYEDKINKGKCENFVRTMASTSESVHNSCKKIIYHRIKSEKTLVLPSHELNKQVPPNATLTGRQFSHKKSLPQYEVPRLLSNTKTSAQLKAAVHTCQSWRHRTWLRTNTLLHSDESQKREQTSSNQDPKKLGKVQNSSSYIRKGNSLIRKIAAEPPPVLLPAVGASSRKCKSIPERNSMREHRGELPDNPAPSYPLFERPNTPPLPPPSKLSDYTMNTCNDFSRPRKLDTSPEPGTDQGNQHDGQSKALPSGNLGNQVAASCKTVETINPKSVTYVKRKKNQLVATPGPEIGDSTKFQAERNQIPMHHPTKRSKGVPFSSSYLYYRSKRNQLIRSAYSSDSQLTGIPACDANLVDSIQRRNNLPLKRLDVHQNVKKPTVSSLVWELDRDKLSPKNIAAPGCQKVFPYLFPWKRVVNWKSFAMNYRSPISSRFSLSMISKKLQCLRKRDTIYKVSTDGFSLRKAGVVSIGGSNLKWSKSIEKRSKKASEEATLAVAEVERTKRERKKSKSTCRHGKNKLGLTCRLACGTGLKQDDTRERIFRFGSARYKMDSTKRTLIRIPDNDLSSSTSQQPGNNSLKQFVPRRLIIGNNEYVRIGNGNQLVRDPKKLQRILASEKIRWSLHTARLKLAQKRQYCVFFTRFGECNKSGGKCPYIHDSSKVAICTKFLKGQCSGTNCKLTHKVIPERMPDCSYFLKGLCTNVNCPYRHVKVNANAPLCDGFLRGHCADGDECRKKHSYTCPLFEATGRCPQGSLCKLRHPKSQSKSRKRKRTKPKSSRQGRYFCSSFGKAGEPMRVAYSQNDLENLDDIFCSDGRFTEYINLDTDSDNTNFENDVLMDSYLGKLDSGYFDMQSCDTDTLIKPVQIMNKDDLTIF